jgi:hypothetical protein
MESIHQLLAFAEGVDNQTNIFGKRRHHEYVRDAFLIGGRDATLDGNCCLESISLLRHLHVFQWWSQSILIYKRYGLP